MWRRLPQVPPSPPYPRKLMSSLELTLVSLQLDLLILWPGAGTNALAFGETAPKQKFRVGVLGLGQIWDPNHVGLLEMAAADLILLTFMTVATGGDARIKVSDWGYWRHSIHPVRYAPWVTQIWGWACFELGLGSWALSI
ncbi:hypothetical protein ACLB2K_069687 [Fragaria x ananassa]